MTLIRAALLSISSSRAQSLGSGTRPPIDPKPDLSGNRLVALTDELNGDVIGRELIPDHHERIVERLLHWSGQGGANLILTSGGTGFSPDDVTPEATLEVIDRHAPGVAEAIRAVGASHTDKWPISRGVAGIRGGCLIINLPGNPPSIDQPAPAIKPWMDHAIELLERSGSTGNDVN